MFLIAAQVGAVGQYLHKSGADSATGGLSGYLLNWRICRRAACLRRRDGAVRGRVRRGGSLTVLYPVYASTFIWAAIIALLVYGTPIKPVNVAGMAALIFGMYLMAR